ncbi:MAG: hypothetical protein QXI60_04265 [Thermofilaceae archaeon]
MGKGLTAGLALALIVVLVLFAGFVYFVQTYYGGAWFTGGTSGDQTGGSTGTGASGKVGLGVIVEYADGRVQTVDPRQIQFQLFPLTVYCNGEPIKKVTWAVYVYLDWSGELTCLELKGPLSVTAGNTLLRKENMWKKTGVNMQLSDVKKASYFEMWRMSLDAADIEASLGSGTYRIVATANVTAIATFSTGATDTKNAVAQAGIEVQIEAAGLKAMLIDVQVSALRG